MPYEIMTIEEDDMHEVQMLQFQIFSIGNTS